MKHKVVVRFNGVHRDAEYFDSIADAQSAARLVQVAIHGDGEGGVVTVAVRIDAPPVNGYRFGDAEVTMFRDLMNREQAPVVPIVRYVRELSGAGLKEAVDWVRALGRPL